MDESERQRKIDLGRAAEYLLENEAFQTAYDALMADHYAQFIATPMNDEKGREMLWATSNALVTLMNKIKFFQEEGQFEIKNRELDKD